MQIALVNTDDSRGGAARSALRLHRALRQRGVDSSMLVRNKLSDEPGVFAHSSANPSWEKSYSSIIQKNYFDERRTSLTNTIFSFGYPGVSCVDEPLLKNASVVNLHWVTNFLAAPQIAEILAIGKPIVWTLHDQWPMTGGCHYPAGCRQFVESCTTCPQLVDDALGLVPAMFRDRFEAYAERITVATPSQWMAKEARSSRIFRNCRIEVIPYGLDLDTFSPKPKDSVRSLLGIPSDAFVMLFACSAAFESRKGVGFLKELIERLGTHPALESKRRAGKIWLLFFGWETGSLSSGYFQEKHLGFLRTDDELANAYNAADVLLHLSSEDNLPNTVLESIACGTPVLALDAGGAREIVDEECGTLCPLGDVERAATILAEWIQDPESCEVKRAASRRKAERFFTTGLQAARYLKLFNELIAQRKSPKSSIRAGGEIDRLSCEMLAQINLETERHLVSQFAAQKETVAVLEHELKRAHEDLEYALQEARSAIQCRSELQAALVQAEAELSETKKQLARARRNIGYKVAHRVTSGLKSLRKVILNTTGKRPNPKS